MLLGLPSLAKRITPWGMSVSLKLEDPEDLQLEIDVARRLRLAAIAHIYPVLSYIARYSCLLARTTLGPVTYEVSRKSLGCCENCPTHHA